jgi:hypothetical protein
VGLEEPSTRNTLDVYHLVRCVVLPVSFWDDDGIVPANGRKQSTKDRQLPSKGSNVDAGVQRGKSTSAKKAKSSRT